VEHEHESAELSEAPATSDRFNFLRVGIAGLFLVILAGVIFVMAVQSVDDTPTLVQATGTVTWDGKPVTIGAVMTVLENDPAFSSVGELDENGHFTLQTMVPGDGTVAGRHKLWVASFGNGMPPPPLVPAEYTTVKTTPLMIDVSADPDKNHFDIRLTGELPQRGNRPPPREGAPPAAGDTDASQPDGGNSAAKSGTESGEAAGQNAP